VLISEVSWASAMLLIKRLGPVPPLALNGWTSLLSVPGLLLVSALAEQGQVAAISSAGALAWTGLAYTVVGSSLIAYPIWYGLLSRHPMSLVIPFTLLSPVVAFTAGAAYLSETITLIKIAGAILVIAGVAMVEMRPTGKPAVEIRP